MPRFRNRLALKIVLPFALLTLAIGAIGTVAASGELSARGQQSFDDQLIHDGFVTQSMVQSADAERRSILRLLTAGSALTQTWTKPAGVQTLLERALILHPNTIVETVDPYGREIVGVVGHGATADTVTQNNDLSGWPGLSALLVGASGQLDVVVAAPRPAIFAAQTVRGANGKLARGHPRRRLSRRPRCRHEVGGPR